MGIFEKESKAMYAVYHGRLKFRGQLRAGTPGDPKVMEAWIRSKMGITNEEEVRKVMLEHLKDMRGMEDVDPSKVSMEEAREIAEKRALDSGTCVFKKNGQGLYLEARLIKATIKMNTHVLFAGEKWGTTGKGPKGFVAERAFVVPDQIMLSAEEPDGVEQFVGHVSGKDGQKSILAYYEYLDQPEIEFDVLVLMDCIPMTKWRKIWASAEWNGIGAQRSSGYGTFDMLEWERTREAKAKKKEDN